ncbi:hypothetical protein AAMO2058_000248800 [Amorphochlora amoebiformis]
MRLGFADRQFPTCLRPGEEKLDAKHRKRKDAHELSKEFTKMDGSVYQWFRKCNQAKPYLKKIVTVSRRYGNEDELKDLDPEEAEKAMCEAFSWDCEIINGIIKTSPYHAQTSSTLLFELRRCKPLKAIPAVVIRNLCQLGQSLPKGFQEYSPALAHELVMSGTNSLRELASDGETKDLDVAMSALGMLPKNSKLAHHLYHALATGAGGEKPSLASVLGSHEVSFLRSLCLW